MKRLLGSAVLSLSLVLPGAACAGQGPAALVEVYKTPTCGCCSLWVDHMRAAGFTVRTTDLRDLSAVKAKHHVPSQLQSCHTAIVDGYVVEGHIPAADVRKLLKERPAVAGIAVPGMPAGSPGMEIPSGQTQPYAVVAFEKNGNTRVFTQHGR